VYLTRDGELLSGAAGQRRLLAVLAVLACVGERGISRDKLLAVLWSDGDPDRTRHALTQSLYHIRKALGSERIFLNGSDLRVNPDILSSDVGEFRTAIDDGRLADAVELYAGPFLDGFYLTGESEFEFWLTAERDRLSRQFSEALEVLAKEAMERGDVANELRWRTRLADHDPLSAPACAALMRCLMASGDAGAAMLRARSYEQRLRSELELAPDRAVAELVETIRRAALRHEVERISAEASVRTGTGENVDVQLDVDVGDQNSASPVGVDLRDTARIVRSARHRRRRWQIGFAAALIAVVAAARAAASRIANDREALRRATIAVSPFRVRSSSASAAYLREALLDLLPTRIGEADRKRTADPAHVLQVWRAAASADSLVSPSAAARVAGRLGAGEIVIGSIDDAPTGLVVHASVIDADTRRVKVTASVAANTDSLIAITDRLITGLIVPESGDRTLALAGARTTSPRAVRAYLSARAAYRRADYDAAMSAYAQALSEDQGFAIAALGLAIAADRVNAAEQHDRGVAIAWAKQDDLSVSDRAFLRAFAGPRYPQPSSAAEVLDAWGDAVRVAPDRAESWFQLGESFYYDGDLLGMHDALDRSEQAFRRALALDASFSPARRMLTLLLARRGDVAALRTLLATQPPADTADALAVFVRWRVAKALDDSRALSRVRSALDDAPNGALRAIAMTSQFDGVSTRDGDRAIEILRRRPLSDAELVDLTLARHSRALNAGDFDAALTITGELGSYQPSLHPHLRLRVLDALYSKGNRVAAREAANALQRLTAGARPATGADSAVRMADECVLGQWAIAQHDTAAARRVVAPLRAAAVSRYPVPVGANPLTCAELLETSLAVEARGKGAAERLAHMDSLMLSGPAVGDAMRYANLVVAREYQRLGDPRRGLAALQRRSFMRGWPRYRATGLQLQIDLALAAGDTATARSAKQRLEATR